MKVTISVESITPELAQRYLESSPGNRDMDRNRVLKYAKDMASGRWRIGESVIMFDCHGGLRNGHHRLYAIIQSGVSAKFMIRRDVPDDEIKVIDSGRERNLSDRTCFDSSVEKITKTESTIIKPIVTNGWTCNIASIPEQVQIEVGQKLKEAMAFVNEECFYGKNKQRITTGVLRAIFVRAFFSVSKEKLKYAGNFLFDEYQFRNALEESGKSLEHATGTLHTLREYLLKNYKTNSRTEIYKIVAHMLYLFVNGVERTRTISVDHNGLQI